MGSQEAAHGSPRAGRRWMLLFSLAWLAIWTVQLTPVQLLLPLQLDTKDTAGAWVEGVVWSGLILSLGGLAGIVAGPVAGYLSDRTRSRWGRRRPWAIGGSLVTAAFLVLTGLAQTPFAIGAAWVGVWIGVATMSAALTALIADQLSEQRGAASAVVSSAQAVGIVVGVGAVVLLGLGILDSYLLLAVFIAVVGVGTAILLPDPVAVETAVRRPRRGDGAAAAPVRVSGALADRDFRWLLAGRLTVNLGNALGTALLLFFLLHGIGSSTAEDDLLLLIVIYTVFVVAASVATGALSDRRHRRKPYVLIAALVQAASALLILASPTLVGTAIAAAVMGAGYGAYMAVGLAWATDMLPDDADNARDLGIVNVSANLGQLLGPLLGAGLVALVGGFWLLFLAAGVFSVAGAVMTQLTRESRRPHPAAR
ncbi:MFS transporter [Microbacterium tumbae]